MSLMKISMVEGKIELLSGLHIGGGDMEMHIGGTDNPVIKNPVTNEPYIPGSSLKGKMRSMMEWHGGVVAQTGGKPLSFNHITTLEGATLESGKNILRLFGGAPESNPDHALVEEIGTGRLSFWDCSLEREWVQQMDEKNLLLTEVKMENSIDRIKGVAENPRNTERVPAGSIFDFRLTLKQMEGDQLLDELLKGLRLLELTGIGGSGSRGYGKITFRELTLDGESIQQQLDSVEVNG